MAAASACDIVPVAAQEHPEVDHNGMVSLSEAGGGKQRVAHSWCGRVVLAPSGEAAVKLILQR